jgi:hypothetical protein
MIYLLRARLAVVMAVGSLSCFAVAELFDWMISQ